MAAAIMGLSGLLGLASLVCFIIFVIQLFKAKGALHGILGIICGLYTLIWGWQNAGSLDAAGGAPGLKYKQWILVWTICIVGQIVLNFVARAAA